MFSNKNKPDDNTVGTWNYQDGSSGQLTLKHRVTDIYFRKA